MVSFLVAMDVELGDHEWLDTCAQTLAATMVEIKQAADAVDSS